MTFSLLTICIVVGMVTESCFTIGQKEYEQLSQMETTAWDPNETMAMVAGASSSNYMNRDGGPIKVIATPYFPSVIRAMGKRQQERHNWSDAQREEFIAEMIQEHVGERFKWDRPEAIDSLTIQINLTNTTYPCVSPTLIMSMYLNSRPLFGTGQIPCYEPSIVGIQDRIYIENERGLKLHARSYYGIRHGTLTTEETFLLKFQVATGSYNFVLHSKSLTLHIEGFEQYIALPLKRVL